MARKDATGVYGDRVFMFLDPFGYEWNPTAHTS